MEHKKLFRRFQRRLLTHGLIRSVLWGVAGGGAAVFICALVWHILLKEPAPVWLLGALAAGFAAGFIPCLILNFPTRKQTAKRLDETGLQERAGTMLAYEKKSGLLVELQRRDAKTHIEKTDTKRLHMAFPLKEVIVCVLCAALAVTMVLLPYDLFAPSSAKDPEALAREKQIHALIDDLRQQVRAAQLSEAALEELEALLDQLEKDLLASKSELEQAALIEQTQENIQNTLFLSISRYAIGRAMQQYGLTEELGTQLSGDHPTQISGPMDNLEENISGPTKQITRLSNNLNNALEASGIDAGDFLYQALHTFAASLDSLDSYVEGEEGTPAWNENDLSFIFDTAEEDILSALEEQAHTEGEIENLQNSMTTCLDSLLGQQSGEVLSSEGDQSESGSNGSGNPSGGSEGNPSGTPAGGLFDSGDSNSTRTTMLEGIYDPVSGNVTYGEVFAAYYAQYLEALDAGEIPEELRPYFERYFSSLS